MPYEKIVNLYILSAGIALITTGLVMLYYLYQTRPGHPAYLRARRRQASMPFALSQEPGTAKQQSPHIDNG
jgi:hypothetical protein